MQNNKVKIFRLILFLIGCVFFIVPVINTERDVLYVISPWIYITCFLFFTRTIEKKREWIFFGLMFLTSCELRYIGFLGDTGEMFDLYSALLLIVLASATIIPYFVDFFYLKMGHGVLKVLAFPLTRLMAERFLIGQQFNISLTQFGNKPLIQSVPFWGDVFVSFIVAFLASAVVYMVIRRDSKIMVRTGVITLIVYAVLLIIGGIRYETSHNRGKSILMAYASGPQKSYYENPSEEDPGYEDNVLYIERTASEAAANGAKLIAYAEEAFIISSTGEEDDFLEVVERAARENDIYILVCLDVFSGEEDYWYNKAALISNEGEYLSDYLKTYLIPVVEDSEYIEGNGEIPSNHVIIDGEEHVISYSICYDATFSNYMLTSDKDTDIFINPSWDWDEIDDLNYRLQGMSAVASGVSLFKPTVDGWSIVTDAYGRVTYKESTLGKDYNNVYYAEVTPGKTITLYRYIYKIMLCFWSGAVAIMIIDMIRIVIKRLKAKKVKEVEQNNS